MIDSGGFDLDMLGFCAWKYVLKTNGWKRCYQSMRFWDPTAPGMTQLTTYGAVGLKVLEYRGNMEHIIVKAMNSTHANNNSHNNNNNNKIDLLTLGQSAWKFVLKPHRWNQVKGNITDHGGSAHVFAAPPTSAVTSSEGVTWFRSFVDIGAKIKEYKGNMERLLVVSGTLPETTETTLLIEQEQQLPMADGKETWNDPPTTIEDLRDKGSSFELWRQDGNAQHKQQLPTDGEEIWNDQEERTTNSDFCETSFGSRQDDCIADNTDNNNADRMFTPQRKRKRDEGLEERNLKHGRSSEDEDHSVEPIAQVVVPLDRNVPNSGTTTKQRNVSTIAPNSGTTKRGNISVALFHGTTTPSKQRNVAVAPGTPGPTNQRHTSVAPGTATPSKQRNIAVGPSKTTPTNQRHTSVAPSKTTPTNRRNQKIVGEIYIV